MTCDIGIPAREGLPIHSIPENGEQWSILWLLCVLLMVLRSYTGVAWLFSPCFQVFWILSESTEDSLCWKTLSVFQCSSYNWWPIPMWYHHIRRSCSLFMATWPHPKSGPVFCTKHIPKPALKDTRAFPPCTQHYSLGKYLKVLSSLSWCPT